MQKSKIQWHTEKRKVSDLIPSDYNPRTITPKEKADLEESIDRYGAVVPLVVNIGKRKNVLVGGHQRTAIYIERGIEEIEVQVPSRELTPKEEQELNLRLNKNTGAWEYDKLGQLDMDLLLDVGFDEKDLAQMWNDVDIMDEMNPPSPKNQDDAPVRAKKGDAFTLGNHIVICGESIYDSEAGKSAVARLPKPTLLHIDLGLGTKVLKDAQRVTLQNMLRSTTDTMADGYHAFCWASPASIGQVQAEMAGIGISIGGVALWIRKSVTMVRATFNNAYEPLVFGVKGKPYINTALGTVAEILNKEIERGSIAVDDIMSIADIWIAREEDEAPREKPLSIYEKVLKRCTVAGDVILEAKASYGGVLMACEQLGRRVIAVEPDPKKVTFILNRWEEITSGKAKKI